MRDVQWMVGALVFALLAGMPMTLWAEGVVVAQACPITWKASPSPNLKEYHLYVTQTKGAYDRTKVATAVPVPTTQSTCQALGLTKDGQYYLVVTAVGLNGSESQNSNEVAFMRDSMIPEPPSGLVVGP